MYSTDAREAADKYDVAFNSAEATNYPDYQKHLDDLWERRHLWCLVWRKTAAMQGNHTNKYAEVTVGLYKDKVLSRCKAYNAVALVDFTVNVMKSYYRHRLLAFAHSCISAPHLLLDTLQKKGCIFQARKASDNLIRTRIKSPMRRSHKVCMKLTQQWEFALASMVCLVSVASTRLLYNGSFPSVCRMLHL